MMRKDANPDTMQPGPAIARWRRVLYDVLEHGGIGHHSGLLANRAIVALIIVNLVAISLQSVPRLQVRYASWFTGIEILSLVVFTLEYLLRMWVAVEHAPYGHCSALQARFKFAVSPLGVVDLLAVAPFWLAFAVPADLRVVLVLRMVRFLKLVRYSPGMRSLLEALHSERRALIGCLVILIGATLFAASIMHLVEGRVQPDKFATIPDAMWWAIVTLGTIGYGDVVPVTVAGRIVAACTIVTGLIMIALPVGIVATAFSDEVHRRDFVVTWGMVSRVPLFAGLQASDIADIMRLLRAQQMEPGAVIARRGEPAHSMYFIAAGEVEIALDGARVRMSAGHFFGEIAALRRSRRSATIVALSRVSLLVLDAHELHALMEREPRIAERVREVARSRLGADVLTPKGDLVTDEIEAAEILERVSSADDRIR